MAIQNFAALRVHAALFLTSLSIGVVAARAQDLPQTPTVEIEFNGAPLTPQMEYAVGSGENARHLLLLDYALLLGPQQKLSLVERESQPGVILVTSSEAPERIVGAEVATSYSDGEARLVNPLAGLDETQLHSLWGVCVDRWSEEISAKLNQLDFERVCLTVRDGAAVGAKSELPPLPVACRHLRIESRTNRGMKSFGALQNLSSLTSLTVRTVGGTVDCAWLEKATELETLELSGNRLLNPASLASLSKLRVLKLSYCRGLSDIAFARSMPGLVELDIDNTTVTDLSPLDGLPGLRAVRASASQVRKLPGRIPELKEIDVMSSQLSDEDVAAFRAAHAESLVRHRWGDALQQAVALASRLRVRSGGTCHRNESEEKTLYETADRDEIAKLLAAIELDEAESQASCQCCGNPSIEFYDGEKLLATLGFHHGRTLRWVGVWPADAAMTATTAGFLIEWLAARDVTGPRDDLRAAEERYRAMERKFKRAGEGLSPALLAALEAGPEPFMAQLRKEMPGKESQARVLLKMLGAGNGSWSVLDQMDQFANQQLRSYDQETLAAAVAAALRGDDRQLRRGAARFWESWRSPLEEWKPADAGELHRLVIVVQQEARYDDLRIDALANLASWRAEIPEEEFHRSIMAGLHDPSPQVRRYAMLIAGRVGHLSAAAELMNVLQGVAQTVHALPEVPEHETTDVDDGYERIAPGASDAEVAALALGDMQYGDAQAKIPAIEPQTPMIDVALALFGEGERLKPEHFATENRNRQLQLAAVKAVVRSKGKHGLSMVLGYRQASAWWEEETVVGDVSRMLQEEKAPGADQLVDCKDLKTLKTWYDAHGAEYLKRFSSAPE